MKYITILDFSTLLKLCKGYYDDENHEHMVMPGMVYISFPTEVGTLYSKKELTELSNACKEYNIPLTNIYGITMPGLATSNKTKNPQI